MAPHDLITTVRELHHRATATCRVWPALLAATLAVLSAPGTARAHPHVWITAKAELLVENGSVVAVRHRWMFDEAYTQMAIDGLDANKDGIYDRAELAELAQVNIEGLKEFDYFTFVRLGDAKIANGEPRDYHLDHDKKGALALVFTLPLTKPILLEAKDLSIGVTDPTVFIDFRFDKADPVTLAPAAVGGSCKAVLSTEKGAADAVARLGQSFAAEMQGMVNIAVPQVIRIDCKS